MKSSCINLFIKGQITALGLSSKIETEIVEYSLPKKNGGVTNLYFFEDESIYFDINAVVKFLNAVLQGNLTSSESAYICNCFTLGELTQYENDLVKDLVFEIADPEIKGGGQN
ncbi:hypothetical protein [Pedobacter mucosus]|uniref:hypothetical protein n=1 Tax=Pedobacter mucosus TaxID=2895286 RepID=UPI001EE4A1C4|nr:hypothetical protein [Pedobacter mucosus]UKT62144.1 hypothetical protein LOK61_10250 [Pedobacter mucosus]